MWSFPRPATETLSVEREPVEGECPQCGSDRLAKYPVVSEGGWWDVVKCQECLVSVSRTRGARLGSYTPLGIDAG
jgi:vanillate/4-hydroxybenzoate decarboxylase subunit D